MNKKMNKHVQNLLQRHVEAFARELAEELARPLFDNLAVKMLSRRGEVTDVAEPIAETAHYDPRTRHWYCPRCKTFTNIARRAVTTHMRTCRPPQPEAEPEPRPKKSVIRICIAPGCKRYNKGPRFHYLCDKHKEAPPGKIVVWRKLRTARVNGRKRKAAH